MKNPKIAAVVCALSFLSLSAQADLCQRGLADNRVTVVSNSSGDLQFMHCTPANAEQRAQCKAIEVAGRTRFPRAGLEAFQKDEKKDESKVGIGQIVGAFALILGGPVVAVDPGSGMKVSPELNKASLPEPSADEVKRRTEARDNAEALGSVLSNIGKTECSSVDSVHDFLNKLKHGLYAFTESKHKPAPPKAAKNGKPANIFVGPAAQTVVERKDPKIVRQPAESKWQPWSNSISKLPAN